MAGKVPSVRDQVDVESKSKLYVALIPRTMLLCLLLACCVLLYIILSGKVVYY